MKKLFILMLFLICAFRAAAQDASNPLGGDIRASSTNCSVSSSCVWQKLPANATSLTVTVANGPVGSFTGTLQFEQSSNGGFNFSAASPASTTVPGVFTFTVTSFTDFRVRASAFAGGDAAVNMQASGPATGPPGPAGPAGGSSVSPNSTTVPGIYAAASPYNAKFDGRSSQDGVLNGTTTVTSATLSCVAADIGKNIFTVNLATQLAKANSTVASCSGANFVMNATATASESGDNLVICSDDTTALTNAWSAALTASLPLYLPSGLSCVSSRPFLIAAVPGLPSAQQAFVIKGAGLNATYIGMVPSFSFTETIGTIFENLWAQNCTYSASALQGFNVVTTEDWSVTGFGFGFPAWPAAHTVFYNVCQFRRMGIFKIINNNVTGLTDTVQEIAVTDNNIQGLGQVGGSSAATAISITGGGGGDTFLGNIIAFSGTGYRFSGAASCVAGCSIIGGLITGNLIDIDIQNAAVMEIADVDVTTAGNTSIGIKVGATATANLGRVVLTGAATGATGISIIAGGKVRSQQLDYQVTTGTPTEINNAGTFFDGYGNNLSGTIVNSGSWFGSGSITGTALTAGAAVPSANWGTSAAVTAPLGDSHLFSFTLTNGSAAVGANPTITVTFPTPFVTSYPVICRLEQVGGTQAVTATTATLQGTSVTSTNAVFTYPATPTVNLTEFYQGICGP